MKAYIFLLIVIGNCVSQSPDSSQLSKEVLATEIAFMNMCNQKNMKEAFLYYADESAVIVRDDVIYKGVSGIKRYYDPYNSFNTSISWYPDKISVANNGEMSYTYGQFVLYITDKQGNSSCFDGIFHTIWKRQKDGSWKYVFD